ncbi:UDP-N-acetylmuramate dehydrogenase, partial [Patescibacteria group bacterium]|nr:UDP-N-acetylmuramate dehydrogenase [Patescibacteria group bacterium]
VSLGSLTTFRTGGPARFLLTVEKKEELPEAVSFAKSHHLPLVPIGHGSNMLPPDSGLNAVLLKYASSSVSEKGAGDKTLITAEAGAVWDEVVTYAVSRGLWGIENLASIPGTMGAAVVQNIGAYGAVIGDTLQSVEAYDTESGSFHVFSNEECALGYRTSVFKLHPDRYIITSVTLALSPHGVPNLSYRDLTIYFEKKPVTPTLLRVRDAVSEIRASKFPPLSEYGTAGSFFLNPIFSEESVKAIRAQYPMMPVYVLPEGGIKVPLAWIFDQILHAKGRRAGGAFIWDKQPLVIAADRDAKTDDVLKLAEGIVKDFFNETGIKISPEVRVFGADKEKFI